MSNWTTSSYERDNTFYKIIWLDDKVKALESSVSEEYRESNN